MSVLSYSVPKQLIGTGAENISAWKAASITGAISQKTFFGQIYRYYIPE